MNSLMRKCPTCNNFPQINRRYGYVYVFCSGEIKKNCYHLIEVKDDNEELAIKRWNSYVGR